MTREEEIKYASKDYVNYLLDKQEYHNENYTEYDIRQAFEKGAKWADNNTKSPWISVNDDLPCNNPNDIHFGFTNYVLAIDEDKNIFIAFMRKDKNNIWVWSSDDDYDLSYRIITHWMPLPNNTSD